MTYPHMLGTALGTLLLATAFQVGCSSSDEPGPENGTAGSIAGGATSGNPDTDSLTVPTPGQTLGGATGTESPVELVEDEMDSTSGSEECARDVYTGDAVDVSIYLLMDMSGSMRGPVDPETVEGVQGLTVWDAVSAAAQEFLASEQSSGFNFAMNTFPKLAEARTCTPGSTCSYGQGAADPVTLPCVYTVCDAELVLGGIVAACSQDSQCFDTCALPGHCSGDLTRVCGFDQHCASGQTCDMETEIGTCDRLLSCNYSDYRAPLLDRGPLPANADVAIELLRSLAPDGQGSTPTHLALAGAYETVDTWRAADPSSRGVVVLLTDGAPTGCAISDADDCRIDTACGQTLGVMTQARDEGIPTFVLGVITPVTDAGETLQQMATAGGTDEAFLVSVDDSAAQGLLGALNAIRSSAVTCEFSLPVPREGSLELDLVNVEVQGEGEAATLPRVASESACSSAGAGWFYTENAEREVSGIELCPESCSALHAGSETPQVDIILGCPQVVTIQ